MRLAFARRLFRPGLRLQVLDGDDWWPPICGDRLLKEKAKRPKGKWFSWQIYDYFWIIFVEAKFFWMFLESKSTINPGKNMSKEESPFEHVEHLSGDSNHKKSNQVTTKLT